MKLHNYEDSELMTGTRHIVATAKMALPLITPVAFWHDLQGFDQGHI